MHHIIIIQPKSLIPNIKSNTNSYIICIELKIISNFRMKHGFVSFCRTDLQHISCYTQNILQGVSL